MAVKKKTTKTAKPSTIAQVAKRFNITAREVRDIATAVSTAARTVVDPNVRQAGVSGVMKKGN
jgi:DNA-directed RNA polymerase sigma subunit (sigma70/sigma32)